MTGFRQFCIDDASEKRCLIIAEVAQSHDGSLGQAHAFIDAVAKTGADAIKFQTHLASAESSPQEPWRVKFSPQDDTRYEYWQRMEFSKEQWIGLKRHADECGLLFLSSPFSDEAVDLLTEIGMTVWKVASGEVGNEPMLEKIARTGQPIILSSGLSDWNELDCAVSTVKAGGNPLAVLQCTTAYPCPAEKIGLNMIGEIRSRFGCASGLSDHSGKIFAGLAAGALGADVVEVHVCMSREMFGPDVPASITTKELRQLAAGIREIETMISNPVDKQTAAKEAADLKSIFGKSIFAAAALPAGTVVKREHLKFKKPGNGISSSNVAVVVGSKLRTDISAGEMFHLDHFQINSGQ